MFPVNRLPAFFQPAEPEPPPLPPRQSTADKLLCGAYGVEIELLRFADDDDDGPGVSCNFKLHGSLPINAENNPADILADVLAALRTRRTEGGAA